MICKNCGAQMPDNSKFCGKCGNSVSKDNVKISADLKDSFAVAIDVAEPKKADKKNPKKKRSKLITVVLPIVLAVAVVVVAVAVVFISNDNSKKNSKSDSNTTKTTESSTQNKDDGAINNIAEVSDLEYIKDKGVLVVGVTEYIPMNYKDDNGNWVGFDTELAEAFAEKLGVDIEFQYITDWSLKFDELDSKSIDCVWNGMTVTDEARSSSSVSDVYLTTSQVVVLPKAKAATMTTVDSVKNLTFAVEDGSYGQNVCESYGFNMVKVQDMAKALLEVKSGSCDGCIIDKTMAETVISAGGIYADLAIAMVLYTEEFGIAFRKDSDVTAELNEFIEEYKASGEFAKLAEKYGVSIEE